MPDSRPLLYVAVALDVEEEGLFSGRYECTSPRVTNISALSRLDPFLTRGVRPTLFCAYPAATDPESKAILQKYSEVSEIGAHLHYWNTPPFGEIDNTCLASVPARNLSPDLFEAKLHTLCETIADISGKYPESFRMGRWDLHRPMFPVLARCNLICDASVRPLHWQMDNGNGPDHFLAPPDPYWIETSDGKLLEVPLTVIPLLPILRRIKPGHLPALPYWGALALLAVYHPLWLMKLVTVLHARRGGKVLSLTWHSSEMMPGATPHLPDTGSVDAFLVKMTNYLNWLEDNYTVSYVHMTELTRLDIFPVINASSGDWGYGGEVANV